MSGNINFLILFSIFYILSCIGLLLVPAFLMHLKFLHSSFSFVAGSVSQHLLSGPLPSSHDWSKVWQAAMQIYISNTVPMIQKAIAESSMSFSWLCKIDSHSGKINFLFIDPVFYILWCNKLLLVFVIVFEYSKLSYNQ